MYKKMRKIIASMLIFILTITHINIIGAVLATDASTEYYLDLDCKVEGRDLVISVNTSYEYAELIMSNDHIDNRLYSWAQGDRMYLEIPLSDIIDRMTEHKEMINLNTLAKWLNIDIVVRGYNVDEEGNTSFAREIRRDYDLIGSGILDEILKTGYYNYINMELSRFIPYNINETKGVVLETVVESSLRNNVLPLKDTKIEINVPSINNIKPKEIKVIANSTKGTNGEETGENFNENNYTYDETSNILTINVKSEPNAQGEVAWFRDYSEDQFLVTYIYPEEALLQEPVEVKINGVQHLTPYLTENTISTQFGNYVFTLNEQVNNLVDFNLEIASQEISKGQIYANYVATNKIETEYQQTITANIGLASITDKIILEQNVDNCITKDNKKLQAIETYNKKVIVDKNEVNKILGNNPEIYIYSGTTEIGKINKETTANSQGKYVVDVSKSSSNTLRIETSKPQAEGNLNFTIVKALKGNSGYTKEQMANINKLELNVTGKAVNGTTNFVEQTKTKEITLKEVASQAELIINNTNLSTVVVNENVKMTAKLKTDTLDCNLYKNPTLEIILPNSIEDINIKNIEVLFDTEGSKLTLKSHQIVKNTDGTKTILINLEGTQTEYTLGAVSKGVNVVITSDITVNKFTPTKQEQIKMTYINNNVIGNTPETKETAISIKTVAPLGVVATTTLSNYKDGAETITSISGEEKTATIPIVSKEMNANLSMEVINNYNNTIDNITILGRTMFKANKDILTGNDLGTTINMPLTSNITVPNIDANKVKVYYSENGEATKDINLASNGWTLTPTNLENVKSYLIVLTDYSINTGEKINFNYTMKIPENLQHNESAYENYVVYFNNNLETGAIQDKQVSTKIGVTTGRGPVIEATMKSSVVESNPVLSGNTIKYTLIVKNTGTETAENVVGIINIPDALLYMQQEEGISTEYNAETGIRELKVELGNIEANESVSKEIPMVVGYLPSLENTMTVELSANVIASNIPKATQTQTINNTLEKMHFIITPTVVKDKAVLREKDNYKYYMEILSSSIYETKQETVLTIILPEEIEYQSVEIKNKIKHEEIDVTQSTNYNYDKKTRVLTINLGDVDGINPKAIYLNVKVGTLEENIYDKQVNIDAKVSAKDVKTQIATIEAVQIGKVGFKVTQTSNIPENTTITVDEDLKYIFTIENLSNINLYNVKVTDILPEQLTLSYMTLIRENGNEINSYENSININLDGREKVTLEVHVLVKLIDETVTIANKATIEYEGIEKIEISSYKHIIKKFETSDFVDTDNNSSDPNYQTKRIMGTVWLDQNINGQKDGEETKVADVEMLLFSNETGKLLADTNGNILRTTTDQNGTYTFAGISKGKYTVIFLYDTANYSATTYRKENVDETMNSDALDTQITLDGITRVAAITEEVIITDSNIYNIDLGLVSNPKFDLKLEKTVSKITVQDENGTKVYEYEDSKLAKKDLVGKQVNNTSIIVEYKIKVTNEGAISGFVKKIADYMPTEMKFSSELNKDWYTSENGVLYNSSLANTIINPGESKEVILTLTKKMTEDNLGQYHNEAEIYEAYNDLGIEDTDSIEGNKQANEDDISSADVLITVKTGEVILFVGLTLTIIMIIGISAYFIKKKVIR